MLHNIQIYKTVKDTKGLPCNLADVLEDIRNPRVYGPIIKELREVRSKDEKKYKKLKTGLEGVTFSGTFSERKKDCITSHSGFICFDIDGLEPDEVMDWKIKVCADQFTYACFISPSGVGLKFLVRFDFGGITDPEAINKLHLAYFNAYKVYFETTFSLLLDESCSDTSRLCFLSHDPDLFVYEENSVFGPFELDKYKLPTKHKETKPKAANKAKHQVADTKDFAEIVKFTANKATYAPGSRNEFINLFAINCKQKGIEYNEVEAFAKYEFSDYEDGEKAMTDVLKSVYSNVSIEFGKYAKLIHNKNTNAVEHKPKEILCAVCNKKLEPKEKGSIVLNGFKDTILNVSVHFSCREKFYETREEKYGDKVKVNGSTYYSQEEIEVPISTYSPKPTTAEGESKFNKSTVFWFIVEQTDKKTGEVKEEARYSYDDSIQFLHNNGFYKYPLGKGQYQFIQIQGKVVEIVNELQIKEFMLDFLKTEPDNYKKAREMFRRGSKNYVSTGFLEGLDYFCPIIQKDTATSAFLYFTNCWLEITKDGIKSRPYEELNSYIWSKQQIEFNYTHGTGNEFERSVFGKFIELAIIGPNPQKDAEGCLDGIDNIKIRSVHSTLGYLQHQFKQPDITKAVIAVDKQIRRVGEQNGRAGKSLVSKGLGKMLNMVIIDGPNFKWEYEFAFQQCNIDTRIVNFNDVRKNFDFQRMFGIITEEFSYQKKGRDMVTIPFKDSPKFYISTNYSIRGGGDSNKGRQQIIEFGNYFNATHTPMKEFNQRFFDEWDNEEWNRFYSFMIECIRIYLEESLIDFPAENYEENRLIDEWGIDSIDWCEDHFQLDHKYNRADSFREYQQAFPELKYMKPNTFTKRVGEWIKLKGWELNAHMPGPDRRDRSNGVDYWTFTEIKGGK